MKSKKIVLSILFINWLINIYRGIILNIDNNRYLIILLGGNIVYFLFLDCLINKNIFERMSIKDKNSFIKNLLLYPKTVLILMITQITKNLNGLFVGITMILIVIYIVIFEEYCNERLVLKTEEIKND